jgi:twitching motility protein PilJ
MSSSTEFESLTASSTGDLTKVKKRMGSNLLVPAVSVVAAVSGIMVGISAWNTWNVYQNFKTAVTKNFRLQGVSGQIVHLDEVLTMSARMAASTGDLKWEERYLKYVPDLDKAIQEVISLAPEYQKNATQTDAANLKLVELEERSFKLVRQGKKVEALNLLLGQEYNTQKAIYSDGINETLENIKQSVDTQVQTYSAQLARSAILAGVSFPILAVSWIVVLSLIGSYIRQRNLAQASLQQFNQNLEKRVEERTQQLAEQERATREESEVLQEDVSQILDVVSAVEEGDLTVHAPVSDRVTGLVSDTLNRLIEELAKVLAQVVNTAGQVTQGAKQLENLANAVAANAQQEAQSVGQVLGLTDEVERSALDSARQIQTSIASLQTLRSVLEKGQDAIAALNQGINVLQQGTDQTVQQIKTLGEFVGLTDRFVQEQSQIASMTQVLAMNASLVAARASEQRDPSQFAVVAREFELIANQVSNLAQRTSGGLVALEQRSNQIHNVVTSIDANVQNLGGLVREFTQGVEQSSQVFSNVQKTANEAVQAGEMVARSSQGIVSAAQATAQVMRSLADLADKTAKLTQNAKLQSGHIEQLSGQLLSSVQFFRLPAASQERIDLSQSEAATLDANSHSTASAI